jgi:hypothetical protein
MCGRQHWWGGSLKTVEGSAGGLASVLLSSLHPPSIQSWPLHYWLVDLIAITKASYYQVRCVVDSTGGEGP